jgi:hypothetical protein
MYLVDTFQPGERSTIAADQGPNVFASVDQRSDKISSQMTCRSRN